MQNKLTHVMQGLLRVRTNTVDGVIGRCTAVQQPPGSVLRWTPCTGHMYKFIYYHCPRHQTDI